MKVCHSRFFKKDLEKKGLAVKGLTNAIPTGQVRALLKMLPSVITTSSQGRYFYLGQHFSVKIILHTYIADSSLLVCVVMDSNTSFDELFRPDENEKKKEFQGKHKKKMLLTNHTANESPYVSSFREI